MCRLEALEISGIGYILTLNTIASHNYGRRVNTDSPENVFESPNHHKGHFLDTLWSRRFFTLEARGDYAWIISLWFQNTQEIMLDWNKCMGSSDWHSVHAKPPRETEVDRERTPFQLYTNWDPKPDNDIIWLVWKPKTHALYIRDHFRESIKLTWLTLVDRCDLFHAIVIIVHTCNPFHW